MDDPWQPIVAQLVQRTKNPVLPMYLQGQNSRPFQVISHFSVTLRLALIAGEIRRRTYAPGGIDTTQHGVVLP